MLEYFYFFNQQLGFYIVLGHNLKDLYGGIYQEHVIERYQAQFNYLHNKQMEDTQVSKQVAKVLQDKAYIKLCHYNTKTFKLDQEIEVIADVKSIPKMQVKVFEINTDNYFRKNMSAFTSDINLDGLIAKYETEFDNSNFPSNQQHTEKFNFPQFNERRGLYVIEFIGNGMSSRAIIQKGNLSLIHRNTIAGQFCFILDENNEICKGEYTGLYFDNNFYQADKQNGRIIVPFGRNQYSGSAIMMQNIIIRVYCIDRNEGFAQLTHFVRETETFNFSASFILHNESVTLGNLQQLKKFKLNFEFNILRSLVFHPAIHSMLTITLIRNKFRNIEDNYEFLRGVKFPAKVYDLKRFQGNFLSRKFFIFLIYFFFMELFFLLLQTPFMIFTYL